MPIIKIDRLGEVGIMPDVAPDLIPQNGFSDGRNFLFAEGSHTQVARGYTNALSTTTRQLGDASTNATFGCPWIFSNQNTVFYYDEGNNQMRLIERTIDDQDIQEIILSQSPHDAAVAHRWHCSDYVGLPVFNAQVEHPWQYKEFPVQTATNGTASAGATSITVDSTAEFPDSGTLAIGIQRITYTSKTATTFNGIPATGTGSIVADITNDAVVAFVYRHLTGLDNWPVGATCAHLSKGGNDATSGAGFLFAAGYENPSAPEGFRGGTRVLAISDVSTTIGAMPRWGFGQTSYTGYSSTRTDDLATGTITPTAGSFSQLFDLSLHTDGDLVAVSEFNGQLVVYTTTNVIHGTYQGNGQWDFTQAAFPYGALTNRSFVGVPNGQFVIGNNRMYVQDGSSVTPVGDGHFVETWFNTVDEARVNEVQLVYDTRSNGVKIKTPISSNEQEVWVYNLHNGTLTRQDDHQDINFMFFSPDGIPFVPLNWDNLPTSRMSTTSSSGESHTQADDFYWQSWDFNEDTNQLTLHTNLTGVSIDAPPGFVNITVEGVTGGLSFSSVNSDGDGVVVTPSQAQIDAIKAAGNTATITSINNPGKVRTSSDASFRLATPTITSLRVDSYTTSGQPTWDDFSADTEWDGFPVEEFGDFRNRTLSVGGRTLFVHDAGNTYNGRAISAWLQREDLLFQESSYSSVQVQRVIPHISGETGDELNIRIGGSQGANLGLTWQSYRVFNIDRDVKQDWRFTTRWLAYELRTTSDNSLIISGLELEGSEKGRR